MGDIFDQIAPDVKGGDIFDQITPVHKSMMEDLGDKTIAGVKAAGSAVGTGINKAGDFLHQFNVGEQGTVSPEVKAGVSAATQAPATPADTSPQGYWARILQAHKDLLAPTVDKLKQIFTPNYPGQTGPLKVLQQEGQRLGQAVDSSANNIEQKYPVTQVIPATAGILGAAKMLSGSLTPSGAAQNIGAEGLGAVAGLGADALAQKLDELSIDPARRATGFMKPDLTSMKSPYESIRKTAKANEAGKAMLDSGSIPFFGGTDEMQANALKMNAEGNAQVQAAVDAANKTGASIPTADLGKQISKAIGPRFPDEIKTTNAIVDDMESLNPDSLTTKNIEDLKTRWGDKGFGQESKTLPLNVRDAYREAYKQADAAIKTHIESAAPDQLDNYIQGKKQMEVANNALRGITRKAGRLASNMPVSLPSILASAGDLAQGNFGKAGAIMEGSQLALNHGAAALANTLQMGKNTLKAGVPVGTIQALVAAARQSAGLPLQQQDQSQGPIIPSYMTNAMSPSAPSSDAAITPMPGLSKDQQAYRTGLDQYLRNNNQGAIKAWQKALKINPDNMEADRGLERLAMNERKSKNFYKPK